MEKIGPRTKQSEAKRDGMKKFWKKQTPAKEELRHTRGKAIAVFAMALAIAVGGTGTWTLLADQPAGLTVEPAEVQTAAPEKTKSDRRSKKAEATAEKAEQPAAESEGELPAEEPEGSAALQQDAPAAERTAPAQPETTEPSAEPAAQEPTPEQVTADPEPEQPTAELETENSPVILQQETPELAAQDPLAAPVSAADAEENDTSGHTPEGTVLLTPEQIREALDSGALEEAEAQCIDLSDENGFLTWLWNWLFGKKEETPEPVYSGWRTEGGKTYYYSQSTNKKVTGIQSIDNKLYYFDANGVLQNNVTFGVDVSKYQTNVDWKEVKKAGVKFVIIRIGYRGYGTGALVLDPMFEEHFTNARNAGLKVGVYFFTQAVNEDEAREEAIGCAYVLNGRKLDYPIYYDTEASGSSSGTGRADGLGVTDRTNCAIAFCEEVKAQGYKPGVYASTTWYRKRINLDALRKYSIWNAHYGVSSSPIDCDMWQGTEKGRISGYGGTIDVNISYMG